MCHTSRGAAARCSIILAQIALPAGSQEPTAEPELSREGVPRSSEPEAALAEVVVAAERRELNRGSGDVEIEVGRLAQVPRMDSASLLRLAPGVLLTNAGGLGHPYQIFLRGF